MDREVPTFSELRVVVFVAVCPNNIHMSLIKCFVVDSYLRTDIYDPIRSMLYILYLPSQQQQATSTVHIVSIHYL